MKFPMRNGDTKCKILVLYLIYAVLFCVFGSLANWNLIFVAIYALIGIFLLYVTLVVGKTFMSVITGEEHFLIKGAILRFRYDYSRMNEVDLLEDRRGRIISVSYQDRKGRERFLSFDYDRELYRILSEKINKPGDSAEEDPE